MNADRMKRVMDETFEEAAIALGGAFALHRISDEAVRKIVKILDSIHSRAIARIDGMVEKEQPRRSPDEGFEPHPAIEDFLLKVRRE